MSGAGSLHHRLRFESPSPTDDGAGNYTDGWTLEFEQSCGLKNLKGGEAVLADRLSGRQPVVITVRRSTRTRAIAPDWRAVDVRTGVIYQIKAPPADMDDRRLWLDILAEMGVAA